MKTDVGDINSPLKRADAFDLQKFIQENEKKMIEKTKLVEGKGLPF